MTDVDISFEAMIARVRERIADPAHWTKGAYARKANGEGISCHHPDAVSFCLIGAFYRECDSFDFTVTFRHESELRRRMRKFMGVTTFNDTHTHAEVLACLDEIVQPGFKGA